MNNDNIYDMTLERKKINKLKNIEYLKNRISNNDSEAALILSKFYFSPEGNNRELGMHWLKKAYEMGNAEAELMLAKMKMERSKRKFDEYFNEEKNIDSNTKLEKYYIAHAIFMIIMCTIGIYIAISLN